MNINVIRDFYVERKNFKYSYVYKSPVSRLYK